MSKHQPGREEHEQDESLPAGLHLRERPLPEGQLLLAMSRLLERMKFLERPLLRPRIIQRWVAAASVLLMVGLGYWGYREYNSKVAVITVFGEMRRSNLPDGTEIIANADTRLSWSRHWKDGEDREVWLSGEAFFHVSKTPLRSRFVVHADHFDVIVTGTQFNVVNRPGRSNVLLKEGSVLLRAMGAGKEGGDWRLKPGDFVEYRDGQLCRRGANVDSVIAWQEKKLVLDNTSLKELALQIREHYGVQVVLSDEKTAEQRFSGILPNDNLEVLLDALAATGDIKIAKENDAIIIKDR